MKWVGSAAMAVVGAGLLSAVARGDTITYGATTINMGFLDIANAGNAGDTTGNPNPCGAVAYAYRISKYEVSQAQWSPVNTAAGIGDPGDHTGNQPVASISWDNAAMFCNWLTSGNAYSGYYTVTGTGDSATASPNALSHAAYAAAYGTTYFLPTEDEWYKAAYYDPTSVSYHDYPTGSDIMPDAVTSGTIANTAVYNFQAAPADVSLSGGLSPYLTMGQGGNVWEWNETLIGGNRGVRGVGFSDGDGSALQASVRGSRISTGEGTTIGFRVASIPEPGSLGLLTMTLAGTVARRKRLAP